MMRPATLPFRSILLSIYGPGAFKRLRYHVAAAGLP